VDEPPVRCLQRRRVGRLKHIEVIGLVVVKADDGAAGLQLRETLLDGG
jgi:hypothetical protein